VSSALAALIDRLPRASLIVGKGGVGKTTCAVLIASELAQRGERTLLISTDPAAALADVLGSPVGTKAGPVAAHADLDARQLDATELRREFLARWRDVIAEIVDRGTYLDREDVDGLVDAALPGVDEIFALLELADLLADANSAYTRLVVDTAPTGHTLRLLAMPDTFRALVAMLDAMQEKHRFMVRALTRRYRRDAADAFLDEMRRRIDALRAALGNANLLAAVLVTRDEPVVATESRRYVASLDALHVRVAGVIVNAAIAGGRTHDVAPEIAHYVIPEWEGEVRASAALATGVRPVATRPVERARVAALVRTLTIVGGKGGVGKSTVSCALALATTDTSGGRTLLVSTDPAPSLADAFGESDAPWGVHDVEHEIAPGLVVRQMDATAAFSRIRDEYQSRIDALFEALVGRGVDVAHDRTILRDLLSLAPPGIDELFALSLLGDALDARHFDRIVVDPAPTGHLLRLLDMPSVALDWTHRLMRLMLKYKDVVALGDAASELLAFAKRTRALDALIGDRDRTSLVVVSLDEPVVRAETSRLTRAVRERGIDLPAIIWNRVNTSGVRSPLPDAGDAAQFCAEEVSPPPIGIDSIRTWSGSWREIV
jgi:arsenite/tail-anchored protein-transporting ATPase